MKELKQVIMNLIKFYKIELSIWLIFFIMLKCNVIIYFNLENIGITNIILFFMLMWLGLFIGLLKLSTYNKEFLNVFLMQQWDREIMNSFLLYTLNNTIFMWCLLCLGHTIDNLFFLSTFMVITFVEILKLLIYMLSLIRLQFECLAKDLDNREKDRVNTLVVLDNIDKYINNMKK